MAEYKAVDFKSYSSKKIEKLDKMLEDSQFLQDELDKEESTQAKNEILEVVDQYSRYKEMQPKRTDIEALYPMFSTYGDEVAARMATIGDAFRNVIDPSRTERGLGTKTYEERLAETREGSEEFAEEFPIQSGATEIGSGILAALATRGAINPLASRSVPIASPAARYLTNVKPGASSLMKQYVAPGAGLGAVYGFGAGEGTEDRAKEATASGIFGGLLGGGLGVGAKLTGGLIDVVRPSIAQTKFAQRVADGAGGIQQVLKDLRERGRTLIEQGDVAAQVRANLESDVASDKIIKDFLKEKKATQVNKVFKDVLDESGSTSKKLDNESLFEYQDRLLSEQVENANNQYNKVLLSDGSQRIVDGKVQNDVMKFAKSDLFGALPDNIKKNINSYVDESGKRIFKINTDGTLNIDKTDLTLTDVEQLRRSININLSFEDASSPNVLKLRNSLESKLRGIIDEKYKDIVPARTMWAKKSKEEEIYNDVMSLFTDRKSSRFNVYLKNLQNADNAGLSKEEVMNIVKRAALTNIEDTAVRASSKTAYLNKLVEEDSATAQMLKRIYPGKEFDNIIDELSSLGNTQRALADFTSAPVGAKRFEKAQGIDSGIEFIDRFLNRWLDKTSLAKADKERVAQIFIEQNPDLLEAALSDKYAQQIGNIVRPIIASVSAERGGALGEKTKDIKLF